MTTDETDVAVTEAEIAALRAENEALRAQLEAGKPRGPAWRRVLAVILAILAFVAIVNAVVGVWLKTTLQNEDRFVSTLQPLPKDESVATALSVRVADGVVEVTGVGAFVAETLPEGLAFLSAPLTTSIRDLTADVAKDVVQSDAVTTVWTAGLRVTHTAASAALSGNDRALVAEGGQVAIDLDEIAAIVVERVEATGLELPDTDISLGRIVIYESDQLATAQTVARAVDTVGWFLPFIALVLIAGALWAAPDRRRMTAFLGYGTAVALLLGLAALRISRNATLRAIDDEVSSDAAAAAWDIVTERLVQSMWALLVLALIVGFVAWVMGPSRRARRLTDWGAETVDGWRRPGTTEPHGFTAFLAEWKRTIQVVAVVLGLLFVLFGPAPSGLLVIFTTAVVVVIVVLVEILSGPKQSDTAETVDA